MSTRGSKCASSIGIKTGGASGSATGSRDGSPRATSVSYNLHPREHSMAEPHFERHVFICTNRRDPGNPKGCCADKGSEAVRDEFKRLLHEGGLKGRIRANAAGCLDQCARGVTVVVYPEQVWYGGVKVDDVADIVRDHLVGGVP